MMMNKFSSVIPEFSAAWRVLFTRLAALNVRDTFLILRFSRNSKNGSRTSASQKALGPLRDDSKRMLILYIGIIAGGLLSVLFGKELCWDLASYHYYNPYALLHHRAAIDYWPPSFIQQYLNPASDFLTYFLINYFSPLASEFILGAIHGVNFWLLYLIARKFIRHEFKNSLAIIIAMLGICGPIALPSIGSFQNDHFIATFVLAFVLLYSQALTNSKNTFWAGLLLGMGTGLKLTAGIYVIGALTATLILPISLARRLRLIGTLGLSIGLGICLTSGYWMIAMWQAHGNPVFPFLNNLFHSPEFTANNWRDMRFLPQGFWQSLLFPFYFSWDGRISDMPFRDFRFIAVYALFLIAGVKISSRRIAIEQYWLFAFFISSYIIWQYYFAIARYMLALELLSPLIIYLLLTSIITNKKRLAITAITLFTALLFLMQPIQLTRAPWYRNTFFNVQLPNIVTQDPHAMVLMAYPAYVLDLDPRPQTYLIPFFPATWRFVGIPFIHHQYANNISTTLKIRSLVSTAHSNIYLLTTSQNMPELYRTAMIIGLKPAGDCMPVFSDRQKIIHQAVLLCPVSVKPA